MRIETTIIALLWIAFWIYWTVSAVGAKKNTKPGLRHFFGVRLGIIVLAAILALAFGRLPALFRDHPLATSQVVLAVGLVAYLLGLVIAVWARVHLARNWGMPMAKKQSPELVTSGPYRYIRHPIYTGILLMVLGSALDVNPYWLLVLSVAAIYFITSAVAEEKLMMREFPEVYFAYKSRTKMLIPFIL